MSEWKTIESAPKDGTPFDVWLGNAQPTDIEFYCCPGTKRSTNWHWNNGKFRPNCGMPNMPTFVQPTHWMRFPEGPPEDPS